MAALKGSQTEKNLLQAFAGESQARNRYTYFASRRIKRDRNRLPGFLYTWVTMKRNMRKILCFTLIRGCGDPRHLSRGTIGKTEENLEAAAAGEHHEWGTLYPDFAEWLKRRVFLT